MNSVQLLGRFARDPEVKYTQSGSAVARFSLAVDRYMKDQKTADFISCVAFGKTAENVQKYFHKGSKIAVHGNIKTGSYDGKDGKKVYTTDVWVEGFDFCESSGNAAYSQQAPGGYAAYSQQTPGGYSAPAQQTSTPDGFVPVEFTDEGDLPF